MASHPASRRHEARRSLRGIEMLKRQPPFLAASVWQNGAILLHQRVLLQPQPAHDNRPVTRRYTSCSVAVGFIYFPVRCSRCRTAPHDPARKSRGQDGLAVLLSCRALSSPTTCRFIPAHSGLPTHRSEGRRTLPALDIDNLDAVECMSPLNHRKGIFVAV